MYSIFQMVSMKTLASSVMKLFIETDIRVNFVDQNNVVLGYSLMQDCCEHAEWWIADTVMETYPDNIEQHQTDLGLDSWYFDTTFYQDNYDRHDCYDEGGIAVFRITDGTNEKFVHLYNCHNGYYGHGFEFKEGNEIIKEGVI